MKHVDFQTLIKRWLADKIISGEQADYMLADLHETTSEESGKKFVTAISLVGATVLTAGVLLVIASNWQFLGKTFQLLLALLMPLIPIGFAYYMIVGRNSSSVLVRVANAFGIGLIGGSLALVGQIYNLETALSTVMWLWAILSVPFIFVFKRVENVAVTAVLGGLALFAVLIELFDWGDESGFIITTTILALGYSALMYVFGNSLRTSVIWGASARALRLLSVAVASFTLFFMTFEFYARALTDAGRNEVTWIPLSIVFNLLFIGFMVFVLVKSYRYQEEYLAVSVIRLLFLYVIVKYYTLFSNMLDTGVLLVVGGIVFISGAVYLEKNKHRLLQLMRPQVVTEAVQNDESTPVSNSSNHE